MARKCRCVPARLPPADAAPSSPNSANWNARTFVTGLLSAPRSAIAPCPANMLSAASGATTARVTPAARLMAKDERNGSIAGATSIAAEKPLLPPLLSLVPLTASTSDRPSRVKPAKTPGVTQLPVASILRAPAGTATFAPAAMILPSRITTVPPSIGALPSPTTTRPPVMAMVSAATGVAKAATAAAAYRKCLISHLLHRVGQAQNR